MASCRVGDAPAASCRVGDVPAVHTRAGEGAWVFDPFMGRGTTGEAAIQLGANFAGVELGSQWFENAERNIAQALQYL